MEEPGRLQSMGSLESDMTERLHFHFSLSCIGEGNGNPLPCSCLENPRDGGAWWAAVSDVTQSRTRLTRLSSSSSSIVLFAQTCLTSWPHGPPGSSVWGFSRKEHWSGLPCPPLGNLPDPGIKLGSPALQADSLPSEPPGKQSTHK